MFERKSTHISMDKNASNLLIYKSAMMTKENYVLKRCRSYHSAKKVSKITWAKKKSKSRKISAWRCLDRVWKNPFRCQNLAVSRVSKLAAKKLATP